jgi:hypothetical protein
MADFFKGLTGGFQSGLQLGEAMRAKQEREALAQIMQEKPVSTGPDFAGQFRAQGLEQGPMPQAEPIQDTQSFMGQQYAQSALTPDKVTGLRYGAMADVIAQRDPAAALRMRQEQTRMEREAELAPLQKKALETQVEAGKLGLTSAQQQIAKGEREAVTAKRMDDFNAWRSQNPQADFAAINAEVQRLGMGVDEQFKVASNLTGIGEQDFKASQQRIQKLVKNQGLDGLLKAHKESNDLDPGSHFEVIRGKGGVVSLNRVDTATGKVIQPNVFSGSEAETTAYLNKAAMDPATIIDYTMNLAKNKAAIDESRAGVNLKNAQAGLIPAQADYYKNRGALDRMGSAQYFEGKDGNTYAAVPVMGKEGLTFEVKQVNQPGVKFNKLGGAGDGKPVEVKEEGTKVTIGGQLRVADGLGNWMDPKGVLPSERVKVLKNANVPDNLVAQLPWNSAGTSVGFAGQAYDVRDPKDMKQLKADYERLGRTAIEVDEAQKAGLGLHSRMRSLDGRTPSPYDSPDVWGTYRAATNR